MGTNIEEDVVAHPMPGWIAIVPITHPDKGEKEEEGPATIISTPFGMIPAISLSGLLEKEGPPVLAGFVVEVPEESNVPFTVNETKVFFWSDRGVTIGERTFILETSVICYA